MRISAFTLIELLLVMALSSIVVVMAWAVYNNLNLFASQHRKRLADSARLMELDQYLRHDSNRAVDVSADGDKICFVGNAPLEVVCYVFEPSFVVRSSESHLDTMMVALSSWDVDSIEQGKLLKLGLSEGEDGQQDALRYVVRSKASARKE